MDVERIDRSRLARLGLFLSFEALLVYRAPNLLLVPRFWAEEGRWFFRFAFDHGFLDTLSHVFWKAGYLNLVTNLATGLAAHTVPLERAPFVTTYTALLVQTVPLVIILYGKSTLFTSSARKVTACLIVLLAPSVNAEVWLTSLHSQIYLGLAALLILFEDTESAGRARRWTYRFLLIVGGLSGVYTILLQPLFAIRAITDRKRERFLQLALVTLALLVQLGIVTSQDDLHPFRGRNLRLDEALVGISVFHIGAPLLGVDAATGFSELAGPIGSCAFLALFLASLPFALFDWRRKRLRLDDARTILASALLVLGGVTSVFAIMSRSGGRYAVLSGFVVLFYVLDNVRRSHRRWVSATLVLVLSLSLSVGALAYRDQKGLRCDGRDWPREVERWRREPMRARFWHSPVSHELAICPAPMTMELEHESRGGLEETPPDDV